MVLFSATRCTFRNNLIKVKRMRRCSMSVELGTVHLMSIGVDVVADG